MAKTRTASWWQTFFFGLFEARGIPKIWTGGERDEMNVKNFGWILEFKRKQDPYEYTANEQKFMTMT